MKRQLSMRGSLGIGGAIFSAGTFWSMGGSVVDGAAGAGATWRVAGGLTGVKRWPVVAGGALLVVVLEGSLKAYANAERIIAAPTANPRKVPIRTLSGSWY